jgi:Fe-S cluster biogenesis protein NfuA
MTEAERLRHVVEELSVSLEADGGALELLGAGDGTAHVRLVLTEAACLDCIVPAAVLEKILLASMARVASITDVTLDDPRETSGP